MPDFQELTIKINAEDNATKVLSKLKKDLSNIKDVLKELNEVSISNLSDNIADALDLKKTKAKLRKDVKEIKDILGDLNETNTQKMQDNVAKAFDLEPIKQKAKSQAKKIGETLRDEISEVIPSMDYGNENVWGSLVKRYKGPVHNLKDPITYMANGEVNIASEVRTIVETYEKITNGIKEITNVYRTIDAETGYMLDMQKGGITQQFDKITRVREQLPSAQEFDFSGFEKITTTTKELGDELTQVTEKFEKIEGNVKTTVTVVDGYITSVRDSIVKVKEELEFPKFTRTDLQPVRSETKYLGNDNIQEVKVYEEIVDNVKTTWQVVNGTIRNVKRSTVELEKPTKRVSRSQNKLAHLFQNIKKILLYRAIRKSLSDIVKAFKESVKYVAQFDRTFNQSMSRIVTSADKIKAGFGQLFQPFIETFAPFMEQLSATFTEFSNAVSKAYASSKGLTTYTKINAKYTKDYAKSLEDATSNLSFDKFESLNSATDSIFESASVEDEVKNSILADMWLDVKDVFEELIATLRKILPTIIKTTTYTLETLTPFVDRILKVILPILEKVVVLVDVLNNTILSIIEPILNTIISFFEVLDFAGLIDIINELNAIVKPILTILNSILDLKLFSILQIIASALNLIISIFEPILDDIAKQMEPLTRMADIFQEALETVKNFFKNKVSDWLTKIKDGLKNAFSGNGIYYNMRGYASGGVVAKDNVIRVNEYGKPEWLGRVQNKGAVVNDTQMTDVMYDAVYSAIRDSVYESGQNITIDFSGLNNNALAKELAKPIANQFRKQNIRVSGA